MILLFHILIALASILYTAFVFVSPAKRGLTWSYGLIAATIATGTYLVVLRPAMLTQACTTGLVYLGIELVGIFAVRGKLARATAQ